MTRFTGPPMDLANMRSLGVTRIDAYCACGYQASIDVSAVAGRPGGAIHQEPAALLEMRCPARPSKGVELKFTKVKLTGPGMKAIDTGPAKLDPGDNTLLTIPITTLPDGKYKIDWQVVSTDGHKTNGTYGFESMK